MGTYAIRGLYLALALLIGLMTGAATGMLSFLGGETAANAIPTGGAACAGTVGCVLLIIDFL